MYIEPLTNDNRLIGMNIKHQGQVIEIFGSIYDRSTFTDIEDFFGDLNGYWATLPAETQFRIWEVYVKIKIAFNEILNEEILRDKLTNLVAELYSYMDITAAKHYLFSSANVVVPREYNNDTTEYDDPDRTYLERDYRGLLALTVLFRAMVPIWSEYIKQIKSSVGTHFKEYDAMGLLRRSNIIETPEFIKLRKYVTLSVPIGKITLSAIIGGVSTEELPDWLFSFSLIRKVCVGTILHRRSDGSFPSYDSGANIVSNVYKHTEQIINTLDRKFHSKILDKTDTNAVIDDDKASKAEEPTVKDEISSLPFIMAETFVIDIERFRNIIDPTVPFNKIERCLNMQRKNLRYDPNEGQTAFCQWVVHPALSGHFVASLENNNGERDIVTAVTQAVLWHWGFPDLAALVTAVEQPVDENALIRSQGTRSRVTAAQLAELNIIYKHYIEQSTRAKPGERARNENMAVNAIEKVSSYLEERIWHPRGPADLLREAELQTCSLGGYLAPPDIRVRIADLILYFNKLRAE